MRGYSCIGLDSPKYSSNIGSVLRVATNFDVSIVAISNTKYSKSKTDTIKSHRHLPLLQVVNLKDIIPYDCIPIAVDILPNARPLNRYIHPERAFYIFGREDG